MCSFATIKERSGKCLRREIIIIYKTHPLHIVLQWRWFLHLHHMSPFSAGMYLKSAEKESLNGREIGRTDCNKELYLSLYCFITLMNSYELLLCKRSLQAEGIVHEVISGLCQPSLFTVSLWGIGLESESSAGSYLLKMAAVVNYSPPWWVNLLHRLPHFNMEFQVVSSDFRPEDSEYQKVRWITSLSQCIIPFIMQHHLIIPPTSTCPHCNVWTAALLQPQSCGSPACIDQWSVCEGERKKCPWSRHWHSTCSIIQSTSHLAGALVRWGGALQYLLLNVIDHISPLVSSLGVGI